MQITTDGGYVFAGRSTSNDVNVSGNHGGSDWWVYKTDNLGTIQWQKSIGGSNDDVPYNIIQTSDGGYAIAGWTESSDGDVSGYQGNKDCWVVKLDNAGVIQWQNHLVELQKKSSDILFKPVMEDMHVADGLIQMMEMFPGGKVSVMAG